VSEKQTCRLFAVKTTGGQEKSVADFISNRIAMKQIPVYSIIVFNAIGGYVFLEAENAQIVNNSITGFKHIKGQIPGIIQYQDIEKFLSSKPIISELSVNDIVEIIAGPFKGLKAKINRIETSRSEVTVVLLDAPYQLPVTIDANYLKLISKVES
jgi:transcriptional antiterminator NusG